MHVCSLLVEYDKGMTFLNKVSACFATTNFGNLVYNASINFGYIGRNFGYFWVFWRIFFGYIGILLTIAQEIQSVFKVTIRIGSRKVTHFCMKFHWFSLCSLIITNLSIPITLYSCLSNKRTVEIETQGNDQEQCRVVRSRSRYRRWIPRVSGCFRLYHKKKVNYIISCIER